MPRLYPHTSARGRRRPRRLGAVKRLRACLPFHLGDRSRIGLNDPLRLPAFSIAAPLSHKVLENGRRGRLRWFNQTNGAALLDEVVLVVSADAATTMKSRRILCREPSWLALPQSAC